jgi:hypothetical protein
MTLQKDPNSKRSLKRLKTGISESRAVRRAKNRLSRAKQGYENIVTYRRIHYVSESAPCFPGAMNYN